MSMISFEITVHFSLHYHVSYGYYAFEWYTRFVFLQRVLIGTDLPLYDSRRIASEYNVFSSGNNDEFLPDDDYIEVWIFPMLNLKLINSSFDLCCLVNVSLRIQFKSAFFDPLLNKCTNKIN